MIKTFKVVISLLTLLFCIFATCITASSAFGDIYTCDSFIDITVDQDAANKPLVPVDMTLDIPISVKYSITGFYAKYVAYKYQTVGATVFVYLSVEEVPGWANATISPSLLIMPPTTEGVTQNVTLTVKLDRAAYASQPGIIKINFSVEKAGAITANQFIRDVEFTVGYRPFLDINLPEGTVKSATPDKTTNFDIEIENLGNALTDVKFSLLDVPDGWIVEIPSDVILGTSTSKSGETTKKTVSLSVKPPYGFGYHNEKEVIKVLITPYNSGNPSLSGPSYEVSFVIQNKGYSTPGFEGVLLIFAIVILAFIIGKRQKMRGADKK